MNASQEAQPVTPELSQQSAGRKAVSKWQRVREPVLLYLAVMAGTVIGGLLRALASISMLALLGPGFPWGTLFVNVAGSFVIGFYSTLTGPEGRVFAGMYSRQFVMTGICGGFTTFSVFSLETFQLAQGGRLHLAALNVGVSVVAWLLFVWIGHAAAARINRIGG